MLRTLFAKMFLCTLAIYPVSRGLGFLVLYLLNVPAPPARPPSEVLQRMLPLYAKAAMASLDDGGDHALAGFIADLERAIGVRLRFRPVLQGGCFGGPVTEVPVPGRTLAAPATSASGEGYCLTAQVEPTGRPPVWGFVTAALLPVELACCALVSFLLARYLARPLRNLHATAAAFADGDLSARGEEVKAGRRDEVADLVRAFNRMADRISAMIQAERQFIGNVSHEIKSPLARISLAAALARRSVPPLADEPFDRLEREIETASSLVRELRVLSSLHGTGALRRERMDLGDLLISALDNVAFERADRPHGIRLNTPPGPVVALGDPALLQRAIENVLRNALFYTPEGTEVEVTITHRGDTAHIEVRDHGPGVPESALPHLFEPFYRVDESRTRNTGGTGIGLAIFERSIALHCGTARAVNASPSGLLICVDLPLAEADAEGARDRLRLAECELQDP